MRDQEFQASRMDHRGSDAVRKVVIVYRKRSVEFLHEVQIVSGIQKKFDLMAIVVSFNHCVQIASVGWARKFLPKNSEGGVPGSVDRYLDAK